MHSALPDLMSLESTNKSFKPASTQDKADGRLIRHALYAANNASNKIIIQSPDTDVFVLLLHHRNDIAAQEIYFLTGHKGKNTDRTLIIPIHLLYQQLTQLQINILLPVYCLTGCDTTSSFYGHGKKGALKILLEKAMNFQDLLTLGSDYLSLMQKSLQQQHLLVLYMAKLDAHH